MYKKVGLCFSNADSGLPSADAGHQQWSSWGKHSSFRYESSGTFYRRVASWLTSFGKKPRGRVRREMLGERVGEWVFKICNYNFTIELRNSTAIIFSCRSGWFLEMRKRLKRNGVGLARRNFNFNGNEAWLCFEKKSWKTFYEIWLFRENMWQSLRKGI